MHYTTISSSVRSPCSSRARTRAESISSRGSSRHAAIMSRRYASRRAVLRAPKYRVPVEGDGAVRPLFEHCPVLLRYAEQGGDDLSREGSRDGAYEVHAVLSAGLGEQVVYNRLNHRPLLLNDARGERLGDELA